jgi:hypothetical protein
VKEAVQQEKGAAGFRGDAGDAGDVYVRALGPVQEVQVAVYLLAFAGLAGDGCCIWSK